MSLLDVLDGARIVAVDQDRRLLYAWFGGHGVHIYDEDGRELDYFTVHSARDDATPREILDGIDRHMSEEE